MKTKYYRFSVLFIACFCLSIPNVFAEKYNPEKKYIATCADSNFYSLLLNLIGSIHRVHNEDLGEIAVFNLGLSYDQIKELRSLEKVEVYEVEMTNPGMLTYFHVGRPDGKPGQGKMVRGWYSFKPAVIKQALDLFPCFLYLDAGCLVLKPLDDLFKHIQQNAYFLMGGPNIRQMTTNYIIDKFDLKSEERKWILEDTTLGISAAVQGISRKVRDSYVMPIFNLSKDLRNFMDDGTAPGGFGTARHDQTLYSIQAALLGFDVNVIESTQKKPILLNVNNKKIPFYATWDPRFCSDQTHLLIQASYSRDFRNHIKYKKTKPE